MNLLEPIEIPYEVLENIEQLTPEFLRKNIDNDTLFYNIIRLIEVYGKNKDVVNLINHNAFYFNKILKYIFETRFGLMRYVLTSEVYLELVKLKKQFSPIIFKEEYLKLFLKYRLDTDFLENLSLDISEYNNYKLLANL